MSIKIIYVGIKYIVLIPYKIFSTILIYLYWWMAIIRCQYNRLFGRKPEGDKYGLMLVSHFPPVFTGGIFRPVSFLKYCKRFGWKMAAITNPRPDLNSARDSAAEDLLNSIPEDVSIHHIKTPKLKPFAFLLPTIDGGFNKIPYMILLALKKFSNRPPSLIIATGPTFQIFIVAYYLARAFNSKLVLDFRDEWALGDIEFITVSKYDRLWEKKCLSSADQICFTTQSQIEFYKSCYPESSQKFNYIPNGWDLDYLEKALKMPAVLLNQKKLQVIFVGTLGKHLPPYDLLNDLDKAFLHYEKLPKKIVLKFVGACSLEFSEVISDFQKKWPAVIEFLPSVSKTQAIRYMLDADVLLLLTNEKNNRYRPGKLYEYLAVNKPILVYGNAMGGEVYKLLTSISVGLFVEANNSAKLQSALESLFNAKQMGSDRRKNKNLELWLAKHTRLNLSKQLFNLFDNIIC